MRQRNNHIIIVLLFTILILYLILLFVKYEQYTESDIFRKNGDQLHNFERDTSMKDENLSVENPKSRNLNDFIYNEECNSISYTSDSSSDGFIMVKTLNNSKIANLVENESDNFEFLAAPNEIVKELTELNPINLGLHEPEDEKDCLKLIENNTFDEFQLLHEYELLTQNDQNLANPNINDSGEFINQSDNFEYEKMAVLENFINNSPLFNSEHMITRDL
ncbi:hypothetical protein DMUE_1430 [Dictyocoela muelleri]|nr:hypothetical protein DMUE_1430 [Dictyocoela muelleri]